MWNANVYQLIQEVNNIKKHTWVNMHLSHNSPSAGSSRLSGKSRRALGSAPRPDASYAATGRVWYP